MSNHPIVHIEIPAQKAEEAGKFYGDLFDWKIESDPMYNYVQFQAEGGPGGGFVEVGEGGVCAATDRSQLQVASFVKDRQAARRHHVAQEHQRKFAAFGIVKHIEPLARNWFNPHHGW